MNQNEIRNLKTSASLKLDLIPPLAALYLGGLVNQPCFAAEPAVHDSSSRNTTSVHHQLSRIGAGVGASAQRSSNARTNEQVRQHRSAHAKARVDHVLNRLHVLGLRAATGGRVTTPAKATFQARLTNMSSVQHLVLTASRDSGKESQSPDAQSSGSTDSGQDKTAMQHSQAHGTAGSHQHDEKSKSDKGHKQGRGKEKEKKGFFHHLRRGGSSGEENDSNSNAGQSGNQGIGDGSNVSVNATATISELAESRREITLHNGTAFVAHEKPVTVKTDHGEIRIAPHSAVYLVSLDKSVGVYNIADHSDKDVVVVTHGKREIPIKAGEQVLLTEKDNFDKANPVPEIHSSRVKDLGADQHSKIFQAEFSPLSALDHASGFHDLINSKSKQDRQLAEHILKTAAVVLHLRASDSD